MSKPEKIIVVKPVNIPEQCVGCSDVPVPCYGHAPLCTEYAADKTIRGASS